MRIIGLTGVIGAGKTTTAGLFAQRGIPAHDADRSVHTLYRGAAAPAIEAAFPGTTSDGVVDRDRLAAAVLDDRAALRRLESIVHPLVIDDRNQFIAKAKQNLCRAVVLDIPLLFEINADRFVDVIITATAAPEILRDRVMKRPRMTDRKYRALLDRQMSDSEKRRRAHFTVDTGQGLAAAGRRVHGLVRALAFTV